MVTSNSATQSFEPRIVFQSNHDGDWLGNWDIYSMDQNGNNLLQLTDDPAYDMQPACSPAGRRITFISERGVTSDLYVMDSDGSKMIRLTHDNFVEIHPSWTPDGTRIAFSSFRAVVGNWEIYAMDANGNNPINLTKHKWQDDSPSWSPDGSKIAFVSARDGGLATPEHVFVMNADGQGRRNLTGDTGLTNNRFPTWSPDGRKIAFSSRFIFVGYDIYVMTAEGKKIERLTEEGNSSRPAFSPDGRKIAFVSTRDGDKNIYLMEANGRNTVKLTNTPPGTDNSSPSWLFPGGFAVNPKGKLPLSWGVLKRTDNP
jgi:Tol biopolymer transport system component